MLSSALLSSGWAGTLSLYLKQASSLSELCCVIEDLQSSGSLQSNCFLFPVEAEFSTSILPFWSCWSRAWVALFALVCGIAHPKSGSILIILVNKTRPLRVISISQNKLRLFLFQHKLQKSFRFLIARCGGLIFKSNVRFIIWVQKSCVWITLGNSVLSHPNN